MIVDFRSVFAFLCLAVYLLSKQTSANALNSAPVKHKTKLAVQLAQVYKQENVSDYLISEKYDGVRAIWKDNVLRTRQGNIIHTPSWFTQHWPKVWLDGELWFKRQHFEYVASTVSKNIPINEEWRNITYMVFDAPNQTENFSQRAQFYTQLLQQANLPNLQAVKQFTVNSNTELSQLLQEYSQQGAEGLMLHKASAKFNAGRTANLLKLKTYMEGEALVLAHIKGKGKYQHSMGSVLIRYKNKHGKSVTFKVGSGFSDNERLHPPAIGSVINFKYYGYTKLGLPRFASFIKVVEPSKDPN